MSTRQNEILADILVMGGGPAGTTFATLMQQRGWKVVLLEKDHHPRFHMGESLLPMNLPIFERLEFDQATGNYSYSSKVLSDKGFMLLGDAFTFIDPAFSSSVYQDMSSGERAVAVDTGL
ncbi:MAG: tryptophan 7-halogenase [Xanthomonadales bacterium]|nr:tryptophan 7-halogenase [Xanthomonadales bacterium]